MDGSATLPNQNPARKVKREGGGFDLWYEGYGAEASGFCVFRGMPDGTKKVAVPVWDDSDVTDEAFVAIADVDAMAN